VKLWDGINGRCIQNIQKAHDGGEVFSVHLTSNSRYLLTGGQDTLPKIWDLAMGGKVLTVCERKMAASNVKGVVKKFQVTFNFNEDLIISSCDSDVLINNSKTGEFITKLSGHNKAIRWIATSPVEQAFMSCSDDQRGRFWVAKGKSDIFDNDDIEDRDATESGYYNNGVDQRARISSGTSGGNHRHHSSNTAIVLTRNRKRK